MSLMVEVRAYSAVGRIAPGDLQALAGALVPVAARLGVEPPPIATAGVSEGLAYEVALDADDDDAAFRAQSRQVGLVFALSRVRPDWSWVVRANPALLADAAGAPRALWIRDGAVVLRHADTPKGEHVLPSPALSSAVVAELVHALGADQLRWLGVAVEEDRPSRRAAIESRRAARASAGESPPPALDGPVAGAADTAPFVVQSLDVSIEPPDADGETHWSCRAQLRLEGDTAVDAVSALVRLRSASGRLLGVAESAVEAVVPRQEIAISTWEVSTVPLADAAAADAWFALHRTHRLAGQAPVHTQER